MANIYQGLKPLASKLAAFIALWWKGFIRNNCRAEAAALTFFTLLAMIPCLILIAKLLSIIPGAASDIANLQQYLYQILLPETEQSIQHYLNAVSERGNAITLAGVPVLLVSVLGLMLQLEKTLTQIFEMKPRKLLFKLSFGALSLILGPFVLSLLFSLAAWIKQLSILGWIPWGLGIEIIGFMLQGIIASGFFILIPARKLPLHLAFVGGILLVIGQNGLQLGFTTILTSISNYQVIYGIFSAIPLLLLWIYFCWMLLLIIAVLLQTIRKY